LSIKKGTKTFVDKNECCVFAKRYKNDDDKKIKKGCHFYRTAFYIENIDV
jgi:hypothetical protein